MDGWTRWPGLARPTALVTTVITVGGATGTGIPYRSRRAGTEPGVTRDASAPLLAPPRRTRPLPPTPPTKSVECADQGRRRESLTPVSSHVWRCTAIDCSSSLGRPSRTMPSITARSLPWHVVRETQAFHRTTVTAGTELTLWMCLCTPADALGYLGCVLAGEDA